MQSLISSQLDRRHYLDFAFRQDRFQHAVRSETSVESRAGDSLPADGSAFDERLLQSLEGTAAEDWPASPVWQELSIEPIGHGPVALLTGRTTRCFWSASVEVDQATGAFAFDIAARGTPPFPFLGSSYLCLPGTTGELVRDEAHQQLDLAHPSGLTGQLRVATSWGELSWLTADPQSPSRVTITPRTSFDLAPHARTVRWKYEVLVG